jgi:glycosyltransferase involved in cell wall biosynthesis
VQFLPLLLQQNHPDFEVIVVNDGSTDKSEEVLHKLARLYSHLQIISLENDENRLLKGKKYALTAGINSAKHAWILVTDADCAPNSPNWATEMLAETAAAPTTEIVLGYRPYILEKTGLNTWTRFETLYTALQYFGLADWGLPYMGVGRNLLYKKELFINNKGLDEHGDLHSGDDDLFIRDVARADNTAICLKTESFVRSVPKQGWADYLRQKRRHLSTSTRYKPIVQLLLGLLSASQIGFYAFFIFNLFITDSHTIFLLLALFLLRWLCLLDTVRRAKQVFKERFSWLAILGCDVFLTLYLIYFSFSFILPKKRAW